MPSISTHTINVNGATAVYREALPTLAGAANDNAPTGDPHANIETVILVHCSTGTGGQWKKLIEQLSDSHAVGAATAPRRVLAPDLCGYGRSESGKADALGLLNQDIALVRALIDTANGPVHIVGHSYGGGVALRAAIATELENPGRIASLALFEPCLFSLLPQDGAGYSEISAVARTVLEAADGTDADRWAAAARFITYWGGKQSWAAMPAEMKLAVAGQVPRVAHDFRGLFASESTENPKSFATAVALLDLPLLLMRGGETTTAAREVASIVRALRPDATFTEIPGAGHMAPLTHADAVNPHLVAHIARHSDRHSGTHQRKGIQTGQAARSAA